MIELKITPFLGKYYVQLKTSKSYLVSDKEISEFLDIDYKEFQQKANECFADKFKKSSYFHYEKHAEKFKRWLEPFVMLKKLSSN